jgi:predicted O-methyltransferase YrrM
MRQSGTLTTVDTEPEYQRMARQAFTQAGFAANQSRLILGRARDVLPRLSDAAYDIVFCDADPRDHPDYLADVVRLLRPGGVAVFNDALSITTDAGESDLASTVRDDERLVPMLLPLGDGLLAAVKRLPDHGLKRLAQPHGFVSCQLDD